MCIILILNVICFSVCCVYIIFKFCCFMCIFHVGVYGLAQPWYFPVTASYWRKGARQSQAEIGMAFTL